jgi:subtilisin family serine protease
MLRRCFVFVITLYLATHLASLVSPVGASAASIKTSVQRRFLRSVNSGDRRVPTGVTRIGAAPAANPDGTEAAHNSTSPRPAAVAILDTGIANIPELNVVGGYDCSGAGNLSDANGHGTHVAGIIGARRAAGRANEVIGVSPGTPLYSVRVFNASGEGDLSNVVCGLKWVAEHAAADNIKVVNMSLGDAGSDDGHCGATNNDAFHAALCRVVAQGVTVVAAAGNESESLAKSVPAAYDEVLSVTAMADFDGEAGGTGAAHCSDGNKDDTAADFSDYAVPDSADAKHTIAAPGVCITSTWNDGSVETLSGSSMASPHVAGLVARCIDAGPCADLSPAQIMAKLLADAAARPADTGFVGDARHPIDGKYYGNLAWARGY